MRADVRRVHGALSIGRNPGRPGNIQLLLLVQVRVRNKRRDRLGSGGARWAMVDVYNVFNANRAMFEEPRLGPNYLAPQVIMPGRFGKFAFQLDF